MYAGNNPAARRSQEELAQALLALMENYTLQEITITMICQEAQISRQTFYQIFPTKEDAIRFLIKSSYEQFESELLNYGKLTVAQLAEYIFLFFDRHRKFVTLLIHNHLHFLLLEEFQNVLPRVVTLSLNSDEAIRDSAVLSFLSGGLCSMILYQIEYQTPSQAHQSAIAFSRLFDENAIALQTGGNVS